MSYFTRYSWQSVVSRGFCYPMAAQDGGGPTAAKFLGAGSGQAWVYWFAERQYHARSMTPTRSHACVGIGGVIIMEVDQGIPLGPVPFASPKWRELFKHMISEAGRLGIEVDMNNDAGWNERRSWSNRRAPCKKSSGARRLSMGRSITTNTCSSRSWSRLLPKTSPCRPFDAGGRCGREEAVSDRSHEGKSALVREPWRRRPSTRRAAEALIAETSSRSHVQIDKQGVSRGMCRPANGPCCGSATR